jgi:hypothetical protein
MITKVSATVSAIGLALILVASASAQTWRLSADIPFSFNVGDQEMQSGRYTVTILGDSALLIQSVDSKKTALSLSNSMLTPSNLKNGKLMFNLYGDQYFLSSVSWPEGPSKILPPTKIELQAAKANSSRKLAINTR